MHEEHHPSKSFSRNTFSRFAKKHDIRAAIEPLDTYGLMAPDKLKEAKNFQVILQMGDRSMYFVISFPDYRRHLPPIEDILEYMANEIAVYENFGTDAQAFATYAKISLEEASRHVEEAATAASSIRTLLGPDVYHELVAITEELP